MAQPGKGIVGERGEAALLVLGVLAVVALVAALVPQNVLTTPSPSGLSPAATAGTEGSRSSAPGAVGMEEKGAAEPQGVRIVTDQGRRLLFAVYKDKGIYGPDEPVGLAAVLLNQDSTAVPMEFRSSQRVDFVVEKDGQIVWNWAAGKFFAMVVTRQKLQPGQPEVYVAVWNRRDNAGQPVPPGTYQVHAVYCSSAPIQTPPVQITLR